MMVLMNFSLHNIRLLNIINIIIIIIIINVCNVSSMGRALAFRADSPGSIPGPA